MAGLQKSTRKRAAAPAPSPTRAKKVRVEEEPKSQKRRSRPVTNAKLEADSEDNEDEWEDEEDSGGEEDGDVGVEDEDEPMNQDAQGDDESAPSKPKDANAARESHKAQKALQAQRKAAKPHSSILTEAKRVWSLARQKNIPSKEREKHIHQLMDVIRGHVQEIVLKHDASRIVQTLVKYGKQKERDEVASELKGKYKDLVQSKYSKFLVSKLIRLCPTHRESILREFESHTLRLLLHREATSVLADAFELWANAYERSILLRDFYGKEARLFSTTRGTDEEKTRAKKGLSGILEGTDAEQKKRILSAVKENLVLIFNNPDKGAITHAVVHRALWEYVHALEELPEEEQEKLRREIFESCQDVLAEMVHTKDGSRVVRQFLVYGTAKDRKQIIKTLKPHIERICQDDEAQLVLFTVLDVVDDTKLVAKSIISEITSVAEKLYTSSQGRRSLLYLLVPRTRRHFTPAQIATLAETDEIRSRTSKKDVDIRQSEVLKAASEPLLQWVESKGSTLVRDPGASLLVLEIMLYANDDKSKAVQTLMQVIATPYPSPTPDTPHAIDLPHTSRLYKTLLQGGHFNHTSKSIDRVATWNPSTFALELLKTVGKDIVIGMCTKGEQNGMFVVAELCEELIRNGGDGEDDDVKKRKAEGRVTVKAWFGSDVKQQIEKSEAKGKRVLLEKLAAL